MEVVAEVVPLWSFVVQLEVVDQSPSALVLPLAPARRIPCCRGIPCCRAGL